MTSLCRRSVPSWCAALLLLAAPVAAQTTGTVAGRVTEASSGAPLGEAQVQVLNQPLAAATNADGRFTIAGVRPGRVTLAVVRIGYARVTVGVTVTAGATATADVKLTSSSVRLNEIVVSADKAEQNIQEVPYAVSVISTEQLSAAKIDKPSDLTGYIPNLLQNYAGTAGYNFVSIRGVNNAAAGSYENAVATYVDGVYVFDPAGLDISFGEVERVEVLRGPQGTLYGRGAMGGVINIITKGPTNVKRSLLAAEYGNYGATRLIGNIGVPLVADKLFFSGEGVFYRRAGIFHNAARNNEAYDREREFGLNARMKWVPSTRFSLAASGRANLTNVLGTFALAKSDTAAFARPYEVTMGPGLNEDRRKVYGYSLEAKYFGANVELNSITGYNRVYRGTGPDGIDADFTGLDLITSTYGQPGFTAPGYVNKALTEEFRIGSRKGSAFQWTAGTYLFDQKNPGRFDVFLDKAFSPFQLNTHSLGEVRNNAKGSAFFGQATYTVNNKLDLTFGLRRDQQTNTYYSKTDLITDGGPSFTGQPVEKTQKSNAWSPKASLAYRPNDRLTVYGLFSRGYRSGGINPATVTGLPASNYKAEYTSNYEVGFKVASKDDRVRANLTAFLIKWTDGQVSTYDFSTFTSTTLNSGKATSKGIELEFSALPARHLQFDWNLGVIDAQYDSLNLSTNPAAPLILNGNKLVYTPNLTSTPAVTLDFPLKHGNRFSIRGEWRLVGKHFFDLQNKIPQKSYNVLNARAALQMGDWEFAAWGKNLNDERYLSYGTSFGGTSVLLATPRTVGFTITTNLWR